MSKLFKINGTEVTLRELGQAWLEKQAIDAKRKEQEERAEHEDSGVKKSVTIIAKDKKKQVAYGVILRPNVPDADGDIYNEDEVEKAAWGHMTRTGGTADWLHQRELDKSEAGLVESVIMGCDATEWHGQKCDLKKGDWLGGMAVPDKEKWQAIEEGKITAFSIKGVGQRRKLTP